LSLLSLATFHSFLFFILIFDGLSALGRHGILHLTCIVITTSETTLFGLLLLASSMIRVAFYEPFALLSDLVTKLGVVFTCVSALA